MAASTTDSRCRWGAIEVFDYPTITDMFRPQR